MSNFLALVNVVSLFVLEMWLSSVVCANFEFLSVLSNYFLFLLHADKILQDELDVVAYRVLAYLLLGVVRIYSKKVEYLFDDCHRVLIKINDFVLSTKDSAHVETLSAPYSSITLPERFELDAFDLGILDDVSG